MTKARTTACSASLGVAVAMLSACWLEGALGRFRFGAWALISSGLLALGLGALLGGVLGALAGWAAAARFRGVLLSVAVAALVFWRVAVDLRLLAMWRGPTHVQGQTVLVVCSVTATGAACVFGCLVFGVAQAAGARRLAGLALLLISALSFIVDLLLAFDGYPLVHWLIRAETFAAAGGAVALLAAPRLLERVRLWHVGAATLAGLGLGALAFAMAPGLTAVALLDKGLSRFVLENARALSDWDRDGYSSWFGGGDCAPYNPAINPGVRDVPGNGIDDNCHAGDARPIPAPVPVAPPPSTAAVQLPSLVLITAEALRADHLSLYGYRRDTTPELAHWATTAWRFDRAVSGTRTTMSLPSLFYGRLPARLVWQRRVDTTSQRLVRPEALVPDELARRSLAAAARQTFLSLPGLLHRRGLRTLAVVDDGFSPYLALQPGYAEEFDKFETVRSRGGASDDLETATLGRWWLRELAKGGPFFQWIHFFGTHSPSTQHWGPPDYGSDVAGRYDHEIRYLDQQLGPLLRELDELSTHRPLVVVVVADHGESFSILDRDHGMNVDEANLHVPLLLKAPGLGSGVNQSLVSQLDIAPTLLAAAGVMASDMDGRDLRGTIETGGDPNRIVVSEAWHWNLDFTPECSMLAAVGFGQKATYDRLREARFVTRFGDFRETPLTPDARSQRLLDTIDDYLDRYGPLTPR